MKTINVEITANNLLSIVPEIIDRCYDYIDAGEDCKYVQIKLDDRSWGELEEITPYSTCHPNYNEIMSSNIDSQEEGIVIVNHDRVVLKPWKNVNRFFRVLTFRANFNEWFNN